MAADAMIMSAVRLCWQGWRRNSCMEDMIQRRWQLRSLNPWYGDTLSFIGIIGGFSQSMVVCFQCLKENNIMSHWDRPRKSFVKKSVKKYWQYHFYTGKAFPCISHEPVYRGRCAPCIWPFAKAHGNLWIRFRISIYSDWLGIGIWRSRCTGI